MKSLKNDKFYFNTISMKYIFSSIIVIKKTIIKSLVILIPLYYIHHLLISCGFNEKPVKHNIELLSTDEITEISLDGITAGRINIDEILDSISFFTINADKVGLLNEINKVIYSNSIYYLLDSKAHSVLIISNDGSLLGKIENQGRGPGEYPFLSDFSVNQDTVLVFNRNKVYKYDTTGKYLESIELDFIASNFDCNNGYYYFFRKGNTNFNDTDFYYDLIICQPNGSILEKHFPYNDEHDMYRISTDTPFYRSGNKLYYIPGSKAFNHIVYELENMKPVPRYQIKRDSTEPFSIGDFFVSSQALTFNVFSNKNFGTVYISKEDSSIQMYHSSNSSSKSPFIGSKTMQSTDYYYLTTIDVSEIGIIMNANQIFSTNLKKAYPSLTELFEYIESDRVNPLLIMEYYK